MRRTLLLVLALVLLGCAKPPSTLSPVGARTFQANQAVVAIGMLQRSAIELNKIEVCPTPATVPACHPFLSDQNTGIVVDNVTTALTAIRGVPLGWKGTIEQALTTIAARLDGDGKTQLASYITAANSVIAALVP